MSVAENFQLYDYDYDNPKSKLLLPAQSFIPVAGSRDNSLHNQINSCDAQQILNLATLKTIIKVSK
jgi:hypothetical protein